MSHSSYNAYEVRLKTNGRVFSRHFTHLRTPEQAVRRAKKFGRVLGVKKVHASDIIGIVKTMNLQGIIGIPRRADIVYDDTTIDSIVFPNKTRRQHRRTLAKKLKNSKHNEGG